MVIGITLLGFGLAFVRGTFSGMSDISRSAFDGAKDNVADTLKNIAQL